LTTPLYDLTAVRWQVAVAKYSLRFLAQGVKVFVIFSQSLRRDVLHGAILPTIPLSLFSFLFFIALQLLQALLIP
jgi:hypothetical protein